MKQHSLCKSLIGNTFDGITITSYVGNKEQRLLFLVVSQSDAHIDFDFARPFFACSIGHVNNIVRPKFQGRRRKFVQPCYKNNANQYLVKLHCAFLPLIY